MSQDEDKNIDISQMSDEEFLKMDPSVFEDPVETPDIDDSEDTKDTSDDDDAGDADDTDDTEDDENADKASEENDSDDPDETNTDVVDTDDAGDSESDSEDTKDVADKDDTADKDTPTDTADAEYLAIGKLVMAEFKANGTTIKVKSGEDAIQLMQMGANYHKKMAGLKPSLKTLKLLENHGLLDETKLNYLIDLSLKKPEAITQLLKDSNIDPMDIDLKGDEDYVPNRRTVNDTELVLDEVLESISQTPSYNKTLTVLGDEWDATSRDTIAKNPEFIRTINTHMENGIYDQVANAVAYERSLGKLTGVSDFDAYHQMGSHMNENKLFQGMSEPGPQNQQKVDKSLKVPETPEQTKQRKERKHAASPTRRKKTPTGDKKYNPLEMSDEDFTKINKLHL